MMKSKNLTDQDVQELIDWARQVNPPSGEFRLTSWELIQDVGKAISTNLIEAQNYYPGNLSRVLPAIDRLLRLREYIDGKTG